MKFAAITKNRGEVGLATITGIHSDGCQVQLWPNTSEWNK
jgi:hypothetical protein